MADKTNVNFQRQPEMEPYGTLKRIFHRQPVLFEGYAWPYASRDVKLTRTPRAGHGVRRLGDNCTEDLRGLRGLNHTHQGIKQVGAELVNISTTRSNTPQLYHHLLSCIMLYTKTYSVSTSCPHQPRECPRLQSKQDRAW